MGRSIASDNFAIDSSINKLQEYFFTPRLIKDKRIFIITIIFICLCGLAITVNLIKATVNWRGYGTIEQIFKANAACGGNSQLL